ncbi:hypothetical protein [Pseudomonas sp. NKUCC02_KPG]|uniref:hypothetical protein n=1 Tax=Pseudomonas sp. NKUCC02_KPG TaxID=2842124 RepID=UPI001C5AA359|nr:hypothetical protein [Pseudomonas sp. NKUCC02_KPG]MBW3503389.1 hypothetical protein [Pseudomonas sp. NKUCC02_KPG]
MSAQKKLKGKKFSIDVSILALRREETPARNANRIMREIQKLGHANEYDLIFKLGAHVRLPDTLNPVFSGGVDYYNSFTFGEHLSDDVFIYWMLGLFEKNRELLRKFLGAQEKISNYILRSMPNEIISELDALDELCKSWWSISTRVHVTKELKKEDTKAYLSSLPEKFPLADVTPSVLRLQLISEGNAISVFLNNIRNRLAEYRTSGLQDIIRHGDTESCRYLYNYLDPERNVELSCIKDHSHESIIDQYVLLKEVVLELAVTDSVPLHLIRKIQDLALSVGDEELGCVVSPDASIAPEVLSVIDSYTLGDYKDVITQVENLLLTENPCLFGLIEVYAKSKIYLKSPHERKNLFEILAADLSVIMQCENTIVEKIENITRLSVKFKTERWAKSLSFHLLSILEEVTAPDAVERSRLETRALGRKNTPKAAFGMSAGHLIDPKRIELLPSYRAAKYFPDDSIGDEIDEAKFPVKSDFLKLRATTLLDSGKTLDAISFAVDEYHKNYLSFYHLPFTKMCKIIDEVEKESFEDRILCLIALDIFSKELAATFEETKTELFEDFALLAKTHRISKIYEKKSLTRNEVYFLHQICIPSQLDNLFQYKTNDEVVHERVAIIDLLIDAVPSMEKQLRLERDNVLESLFVEKLRAKIESGKLFVDVHEIESQRKHVYSALFAQAKSIPGGVVLAPVGNVSDLEISKDFFKISDTNAIASTEKTDVLYKIFITAIDDFALNESYGLDKYLSAEIRHIVFEAQLRACFEKTKLVTVQKNGEYNKNIYWLNFYNYIQPGLTGQIDGILQEFSQKIDALLELTNEQFRVDSGLDGSGGIFDFKPYHKRLVKLSHIIHDSSNANVFFKSLLEFMWEIAGESARRAQLLIANDLAGDVNELIMGLEEQISQAKGGIAMMDLMQEIKNARSMFTKQIEVVTNWFKFVGDQSAESFERLGVVIEASVSSFESIYGHGDCSVQFTQAKSSLLLSYREARSLFIAIFTALENAYKYGVEQSPIVMQHEVTSTGNAIYIRNNVSEISAPELPETIRLQKSKWTPDYLSLNRQEGGAGLYKIFSILTNSSPGFDFDIESERNQFVAIMRLRNEYFGDRRQLP